MSSLAFAPAALRDSGFLGRQSVRGGAQARRPVHRSLVRPSAAASDSASWRQAQAAFQRQASDARAKLEQWARQQRLDQRINSGLEAATRAAAQAAEQAQASARKVDEEYDVLGKAAGAARTVNDTAEELDSKFQFRRRLRIFLTDARRMLPLLGRRLHDFSGTPMGAITFFFAFLVSVFTGAFWVILRLLFSLMWIGILLSPMLINYINARMMAEQQERYKEYVEEQRRREANPFRGTILEEVFARGPRSGRRKAQFDSQDVIDVSAEHIYDSD